MFNFNVGFLQDILSCEMKNFDGLIWFLRDMSEGPTAFRKEYPVSVRSTLNLIAPSICHLLRREDCDNWKTEDDSKSNGDCSLLLPEYGEL